MQTYGLNSVRLGLFVTLKLPHHSEVHMPGALVGVGSCAGCGKLQTAAGVLCQSCGTVLTPAARGSVLGSYAPLLAGVARASAVRGNLAVLIDVLPLAGRGGGCGLSGRCG